MADTADMADDIIQERISIALRRASAPIPAGVAGECENCGDEMPRLVNGLCGFCRDGRRPMLSRPAPIAPAEDEPEQEEVVTVAETQDAFARRQIGFSARGDVLRAIEQRAETKDIALGQAAAELIEIGMVAERPAPTTTPQDPATPLEIALREAGFSLDGMFAALLERARVADEGLADRLELEAVRAQVSALETERDTAAARAEAAEEKLGVLRGLLA